MESGLVRIVFQQVIFSLADDIDLSGDGGDDGGKSPTVVSFVTEARKVAPRKLSLIKDSWKLIPPSA